MDNVATRFCLYLCVGTLHPSLYCDVITNKFSKQRFRFLTEYGAKNLCKAQQNFTCEATEMDFRILQRERLLIIYLTAAI